MANEQKDSGAKKVQMVGLSVHALNILQQVGQEAEAYGIVLGIGLIFEILQKIAMRASKLHDAELDRLINKLHIYEDMELYAKEQEAKK